MLLRRLCHSAFRSYHMTVRVAKRNQLNQPQRCSFNLNSTNDSITVFLKTAYYSTPSSRKHMFSFHLFFVPKDMSQGIIEDKNWSLSLRASWGWSHGVKGSTSQEGKEIASSWITACGRFWWIVSGDILKFLRHYSCWDRCWLILWSSGLMKIVQIIGSILDKSRHMHKFVQILEW